MEILFQGVNGDHNLLNEYDDVLKKEIGTTKYYAVGEYGEVEIDYDTYLDLKKKYNK